MSTFEQKIEEEFDDFEFVEKEEERTESPNRVEVEDGEEGMASEAKKPTKEKAPITESTMITRILERYSLKAVETEEQLDAPELPEAKESDNVEVEDSEAEPEGAEEHALITMSTLNSLMVENYFERHSLKGVATEEKLEASESARPCNILEQFEDQNAEEGEYGPGAEDTTTGPEMQQEEDVASERIENVEDVGDEIKKEAKKESTNIDDSPMSMIRTTITNQQNLQTMDIFKNLILIFFVYICVFFLSIFSVLMFIYVSVVLDLFQPSKLADLVTARNYILVTYPIIRSFISWRPPSSVIVYAFLFGLFVQLCRRGLRNLNWKNILFVLTCSVLCFLYLYVHFYIFDLINSL